MKLAIDNTFSARTILRRKPSVSLPPEPAFWLGGVSTVMQWNADNVFPQTTPIASFNGTDGTDTITLAQATGANQPSWGLTNFKSAAAGVGLDGSNDYMSVASTTGLPTGSSAGEIWAIVNQTTTASTTDDLTIIAYGGTSAGTYRAIQRVVVDGVNRVRVTDGTVSVTDTMIDFSGIHYIRAWFDGSLMGLAIDGNDVGSTALTPATGTSILTLGIATTATGATWGGEIANFMIEAGACDATDIAHNQQYGIWFRNLP